MVGTVIATTSTTTSIEYEIVQLILSWFGILLVMYVTFSLAYYAIRAVAHIIKHIWRKKHK